MARGKKPSQNSPKNYFDKEQEEAVKLIIASDCEKERNELYEKYLKEPLRKMAESIINRYKLYSSSLSFEELLNDALSHLYIQTKKFSPERGTKAYSYFGTVIKNHCIGIKNKEHKELTRSSDYDTFLDGAEDNIRYSYHIDETKSFEENFIIDVCKKIEDEISRISDVELIAVGEKLLYFMRNWQNIFLNEVGESSSEKSSAKSPMDFLKEKNIRKWIINNSDITELQLRRGLKYYRSIYLDLKEDIISSKKYE